MTSWRCCRRYRAEPKEDNGERRRPARPANALARRAALAPQSPAERGRRGVVRAARRPGTRRSRPRRATPSRSGRGRPTTCRASCASCCRRTSPVARRDHHGRSTTSPTTSCPTSSTACAPRTASAGSRSSRPSELTELEPELTAFERRVSDDRRDRYDRLDALSAELVRRYREGEASVDGLLGS